MGRLIYDKGWHGGNRAKGAKPEEVEQDDWIECEECKQPDSQHHWIRKCDALPFKSTRRDTLHQVKLCLQDIRFGGKGNEESRKEMHNVCQDKVDFAT